MSDIPLPNGVTLKEDTEILKMMKENAKYFQSITSNYEKFFEMISENLETLNDSNEEIDDQLEQNSEEQKKLTTKLFEGFENTVDALKTNMKNLQTSLIDAAISPLKIITNPLKDLLGIDLKNIFSTLSQDIKKKIKGKKNPSEGDVVATGDQGTNTLYIVSAFEKLMGKNEKGELDVSGFPSGLAKFLPALGSVLGIAALAGGVIWAIIDGIQGFFKSKEWGVGKVQGVIAGVLAGTGKGWTNAFKNAGKWALIGAGGGFLIGGPIGALIGGLIGAALGGILGYIGGEQIAKIIQGTPKFFEKLVKDIKQGFINFLANPFVSNILGFFKLVGKTILEWMTIPWRAVKDVVLNLFKSFQGIWMNKTDNILQKVGKTIGKAILIIPEFIFKFIVNLFTNIKDFIITTFIGGKDPITGKIRKSTISKMGDFITNIANMVINFLSGAINKSVTFLKGVPSLIIDKVIPTIINFFNNTLVPMAKDFFSGVINSVQKTLQENPLLKDIVDLVFSPIQFVIDTVTAVVDEIKTIFKDPVGWGKEKLGIITNFFDDIVSGFQNFTSDPLGFAKGIVNNIMSSVTYFFTGITDLFEFLGSKNIFELVDTIVKKGISGYFGEFQEFRQSKNVEKGTPSFTTVEDAIIKKDGQIIRTSPDDNIIATKTEPMINGGNNNFSIKLLEAIENLNITLQRIKPNTFIQQTTISPLLTKKDLLESF